MRNSLTVMFSAVGFSVESPILNYGFSEADRGKGLILRGDHEQAVSRGWVSARVYPIIRGKGGRTVGQKNDRGRLALLIGPIPFGNDRKGSLQPQTRDGGLSALTLAKADRPSSSRSRRRAIIRRMHEISPKWDGQGPSALSSAAASCRLALFHGKRSFGQLKVCHQV